MARPITAMNENRHLSAFTRMLVFASGLFVICVPEVNGTVGTVPTAIGWKDEDTRLPCIFEVTPEAVYWVKENMVHQGGSETVTTFFNGEFTSKKERFYMNEDFSLVITNLEVADEGLYHCQVVLANFDDFSNSTVLTINAMAKDHTIEQCVGEANGLSSCTIHTSKEAPTFHLDCRATGFRPNVSLIWSKSGRELPPVRSNQYTLPDGTFERLETITVTATPDTEQNFTCTTSGDSVNGTSSKFVTVLPLKEENDSPGLNRMALGIGLALVFVVLVIIVLFLVTGKLLQKYNPELMPEGLTRIPCWKKPEKPIPLIEKRAQFREELRDKIRNYRPGSAQHINLGNQKHVNITLFGQMSAGKSAFINSLFFAFRGYFDSVAAEGSAESGGGQTKQRIHHPLTEYITVQDNRGMQSFELCELDRIKDEIHGCRSVDTQHKIKRDKSQECHAAIFVYHKTHTGEQEAYTFIYNFFDQLKKIHATSPLLVITHGDEYPDNDATNAVIRNVNPYVGNKKRILLLANYTENDHEEDIEKDIRLLEFLWTTLKTCDQNAYNLAIKNKEVIVEMPREQPRPKPPPASTSSRSRERESEKSKQTDNNSWGCSVM